MFFNMWRFENAKMDDLNLQEEYLLCGNILLGGENKVQKCGDEKVQINTLPCCTYCIKC